MDSLPCFREKSHGENLIHPSQRIVNPWSKDVKKCHATSAASWGASFSTCCENKLARIWQKQKVLLVLTCAWRIFNDTICFSSPLDVYYFNFVIRGKVRFGTMSFQFLQNPAAQVGLCNKSEFDLWVSLK
jgi:hypothetical protein